MTEPATMTPQPVLFVEGDAVRTMSTDVASLFEKSHKHVLRQIDQLIVFEPTLCGSNFGPTSISIPGPRGGTRTERAFSMDRDGFTLLAMGFTGQKALRWKIGYIQAFNLMERELLDRREAVYVAEIDRAEASAAKAEARIAAMSPAASVLGRYTAPDALYTLAETARIMRMSKSTLIAILKAEFLFNDDGALRPRPEYVSQGLFREKRVRQHRNSFMFTQVTAKGLERIDEHLRHGYAMAKVERH